MDALPLNELRNGPPAISPVTAAAAIGVDRTKAYELARQGQLPVTVTRVGATYRVPVAGLLRFLDAIEAS
jgi:hypothetical protein